MRKDDFDGSDSDGDNFEAVTPEHYSVTPEEPQQSNGERHRHILEDVDGELEMEDVAPSEAEMNMSNNVGGITSNSEVNDLPFHGPPLPSDVPPSSPPLPTSPPPHAPPQNHCIHAPPVHSQPSIPSMSVPQAVCPSHGHTMSLAKDHRLLPHPSAHPLSTSSGCPPQVHPVPVHPQADMLANGTDLMLHENRHVS